MNVYQRLAVAMERGYLTDEDREVIGAVVERIRTYHGAVMLTEHVGAHSYSRGMLDIADRLERIITA